MVASVSDARSNKNEQIVYAAEAIGSSLHRALVFEAICFGKSKTKSIAEIMERTKLPRKRVLEEGRKLVNKQIVVQTDKNGEVAYEKDAFLAAHRGQVLNLAANPRARAALPTKRSAPTGSVTIRIAVPVSAVKVRQITVDDIDSFAKVRSVTVDKQRAPLPESKFKAGLKKIIGENGTFTDWGGEKNDLWTTRFKFQGKRKSTAFALKGPGLKSRLTPARMGKNGDQIQRLFTTSAEVFLVQHWREIDESVVVQMETFAKVKALAEGREILFGVIDGHDSARLLEAYPLQFK